MDITTLGAALAIAKSIPGTAVGDATAAANNATSAANRAEAAASTVENSVESIKEYENTGIVMVNGKLCVKVERS